MGPLAPRLHLQSHLLAYKSVTKGKATLNTASPFAELQFKVQVFNCLEAASSSLNYSATYDNVSSGTHLRCFVFKFKCARKQNLKFEWCTTINHMVMKLNERVR